MNNPSPKRRRTQMNESSPPSNLGRVRTIMMNENDEDLGFEIRCSDNESYSITPQDAQKLQDACDYFGTVFRHNMIETSTRVIHKPDWTHDTVRLLLALILKGNVSVTHLEDLVRVTSAADQVLLEYNMYSPFERGELLQQDTKTLFLELADPSKAVFEFQGPSQILNDWKEWLQKGLFHSIDWKMFVIVRANNADDDIARHNEMGRDFYYVHHMNYSSWQVHSYDAVAALQHLCQGLKRVTIEPDEDEFYKLGVLYPHKDIDDNLAVQIATETGGRSFSATFWDELITLCGPFKMLHNGFCTMRRHLKQNKVILRIKTKSPVVVSRIIEACCYHCEDHTGSLGIDITGSIVLFKTIYDMSSILQFLAEITPTSSGADDDTPNKDHMVDGSSTTETPHNDDDDDHEQETTTKRKLFDEPFRVKFIDGDSFVMDSSFETF